MAMRIKNPVDLGAGALITTIAVLFLAAGWHLPHGRLSNMGAGYFPRYVAGLACALGLVLILRSLRFEGGRPERLAFRPILMPVLAIAVFGFATEPLGLGVSAFLAVTISSAAIPRDRWNRTLAVAVFAAAAVCVVFVYGLRLPVPILPEFPR